MGVSQGCLLSHIINYLIQYIHFRSSYMMTYLCVKFKENPCVGTFVTPPFHQYINMPSFLAYEARARFVFLEHSMHHLEEEKFFFSYMYYFNIFTNALRNDDAILCTFQLPLVYQEHVYPVQASSTLQFLKRRCWNLMYVF